MSSQSAPEHGIVWNWLFGWKHQEKTEWQRFRDQNQAPDGLRTADLARDTDGISPVQYPLHQPPQERRFPALVWCEQRAVPQRQVTGPLVRRIEEPRRITYTGGRLVPLNELTPEPVPVKSEPLEVPNRLPDWILPPESRMMPFDTQAVEPIAARSELLEIQGRLPEDMLSLDNRDAINRALDAMFAENDEREQLAQHINEGRAALLGVTEDDCQPDLKDEDGTLAVEDRALYQLRLMVRQKAKEE